MELDFDSWEDYKPVGNGEIKVDVVDNPNILKLRVGDELSLLEIEQEDYNEIFNHYLEEDYNGDEFVRFKKTEEFEDVVVFECVKNEDSFILKKDDKLYYLNVYQINNYYKDGNKITFCGWDYNIIVNIKKMTSKTINVR